MDLVSENIFLKEKIAELEEELKQVREAFAPPLNWRAIGLTVVQGRIVAALYSRSPNIISYESMYVLANVDYNNLKVHMAKIRPKLDKLGVAILTDWGRGHYITVEDKRKIAQAIGEE